MRVAEKPSNSLPWKEVWEEWGFIQAYKGEINPERKMDEVGICVSLSFYAGVLVNVRVRGTADDVKVQVTALEEI